MQLYEGCPQRFLRWWRDLSLPPPFFPFEMNPALPARDWLWWLWTARRTLAGYEQMAMIGKGSSESGLPPSFLFLSPFLLSGFDVINPPRMTATSSSLETEKEKEVRLANGLASGFPFFPPFFFQVSQSGWTSRRDQQLRSIVRRWEAACGAAVFLLPLFSPVFSPPSLSSFF